MYKLETKEKQMSLDQYEEADMFFRSSLASALERYKNEKKRTIFEIAMSWTEQHVEDIWDYEDECGEIFDAWTA
jgi:3-methyladenine DNA glycosylase AlkC